MHTLQWLCHTFFRAVKNICTHLHVLMPKTPVWYVCWCQQHLWNVYTCMYWYPGHLFSSHHAHSKNAHTPAQECACDSANLPYKWFQLILELEFYPRNYLNPRQPMAPCQLCWHTEIILLSSIVQVPSSLSILHARPWPPCRDMIFNKILFPPFLQIFLNTVLISDCVTMWGALTIFGLWICSGWDLS